MTRAIAPLTDAERASVIAKARECVGVRWRHQGRSMRGFDCAGLIAFALQSIGREPLDMIGYPRRPYLGKLEETMRRNFGEPVKGAVLRPGDVVVMKAPKNAPNHVGIIAEHNGYLTMIHAHAPDRKVVEARLDADWRNRIVEVYR